MPSDTPSNITIGSTNIRLSNIKNAFIGTTYKLSDYYRGGTNIYNLSRLNSIPTSGRISFNNFANTTNVIQTNSTITSTNNIPDGPDSTNKRTYNHSFNLPSDFFKLKSINYISFYFLVSTSTATRTNVQNSMSNFKIYLNDNNVSSSIISDTNNYPPNYLFQLQTITSTHSLLANNNQLYVSSLSNMYAYTSAYFEIFIIYIK